MSPSSLAAGDGRERTRVVRCGLVLHRIVLSWQSLDYNFSVAELFYMPRGMLNDVPALCPPSSLLLRRQADVLPLDSTAYLTCRL